MHVGGSMYRAVYWKGWEGCVVEGMGVCIWLCT